MSRSRVRCFLATLLLAAAPAWSAQTITSPAPIPARDDRLKVFLASSIEMGKTGDRQAQVQQALADEDVLLLNPRRADWNPPRKPEAGDAHFRAQVQWELAALEQADLRADVVRPRHAEPDHPAGVRPVCALGQDAGRRAGRLLAQGQSGHHRRPLWRAPLRNAGRADPCRACAATSAALRGSSTGTAAVMRRGTAR